MRKTILSRPRAAQSNIPDVLLETYAANNQVNQLLFAHLDARAWRAGSPAVRRFKGRTIADVLAHMHNNRLVWLNRSAPHLRCPAPLDPERCTLRQTAIAHRKSATGCLRMLQEAFAEGSDRRVTRFSHGSWAPEWPAGATMFAYMFAHEAHHRGQVIALAHQLGYRLPEAAAYGIWRWEKLWKELGFSRGPR